MSKLSYIFLGGVLACSALQAAGETTGVINFDVGRSPTADHDLQPVTLFGCNNTTVEANVFWDTDNQVVGDIPYGERVSTSGKPYFLAKYYLASPPAYRSTTDKTDPILGISTPDRFTFKGDKPGQIVDLDYRIMQPTYLKKIEVDFNYDGAGYPSCASQGVTAIPINTSCPDLSWNNGAQGGAGIGQLSTSGGKAFLPLAKKDSEPKQCTVTLLDDVLLEHEMFFARGEALTKEVNLTALYVFKQQMNLVCIPRPVEEIPAGCSPAQ